MLKPRNGGGSPHSTQTAKDNNAGARYRKIKLGSDGSRMASVEKDDYNAVVQQHHMIYGGSLGGDDLLEEACMEEEQEYEEQDEQFMDERNDIYTAKGSGLPPHQQSVVTQSV